MSHRLSAIQLINGQIKENRRHYSKSDGTMNKAGVKAQTAFANWLLKTRLVESLLGAEVEGKKYETRREIVKNLAPTFDLLCTRATVDNKLLDCLWETLQRDTGADMRRTIFSIVGSLGGSLKLEQLDYLFAKIRTLQDDASFDSAALNLVRQFTRLAIPSAAKAGEVRLYGLDVLWDLMQDDSPVSPDMATQAQRSIPSLLTLDHERKLTGRIIGKCMEHASRGVSVVQCLRVAQEVMRQLQGASALGTGAGGSTVEAASAAQGVLDTLESTHNVVALVIGSIEEYIKAANAAIAACETTRAAGLGECRVYAYLRQQ